MILTARRAGRSATPPRWMIVRRPVAVASALVGKRGSGATAVSVALLAVAGCGGHGVPATSVALVGDSAIARAAFNHWLTIEAGSSRAAGQGRLPSAPVPVPPHFTACVAQKKASAAKPAAGQATATDAAYRAECTKEYGLLRDRTMQLLVGSTWIQGEASDQGVALSDAQFRRRFRALELRQFPNEAAFQKFLSESGMSLQDLQFRMRAQMAAASVKAKITKGSASITPAELASYYERNKSRFAQPERRDLVVLLTRTRGNAESARRRIESGASFSSVARRVSIDPATKSVGGALAGAVRGQLPQSLERVVFAARKRTLTGPVKTPFGFYVFSVRKITPPSHLGVAAREVKQLAISAKRQKVIAAFDARFRKKWIARTSCRPGFVMMDCKNYKAAHTR